MQRHTPNTSVPVQSSRAVRMAPLVEPAWLEAHLEDADLRILDVTIQVKLRPFPRMRSGKREWKRAHIPGAVFADCARSATRTRRRGRSQCLMRAGSPRR